MKNLFNFYLDDETKMQATNKLVRLCKEQAKGQLAALIRVLLNIFINTPDDKVDPLLIQAIAAEYEYTTKKNKRSKM